MYIDNKEIYVQHGKIFLIGDNLNKSIDSRDFGAVPFGLIKNRVFLKVKQDFLNSLTIIFIISRFGQFLISNIFIKTKNRDFLFD